MSIKKEIKAGDSNDEVVLKKKVVYAEIDDEVTEIFDKIKEVNAKHVYLVLPKRAVLFQSIVNLKILKRKVADAEKKIFFVTNDPNGVYLAQQVGIEVYNKANEEGKPALFSTDVDDEKLRITPLKASVNAIDEQAPTRLQERKLSISEILRKGRGRNKSVNISPVKPSEKKKKEKSKFVIVSPNRQALIALSVFSVFILLIIIYIALPGVTIYLTPSASVLEKSVNITLADYQKNSSELETHPPHMIASYPVEITVSRTITHYATGKKFSERGSNASGKITIINTTGDSWPLVNQTRFQTDEGIVFRLQSPVTVPAASGGNPGKVEAFVVADVTDAYNAIVGERGNIEPSRFYLPGLKDSSRSKLYAESYEPMVGGVTDYITFVTADDLEAAKARMNDELLKDAISELKSAVNEKSELTDGIVYTLLEGDGAVLTDNVDVMLPQGLEGQVLSEFQVNGEVHVSGVYYEQEDMLAILVDELLLKKSPQKELLRINEDSTSYRIFEWNEGYGKIKITANIKGIEQYSINPEQENGARLLAKIREHISGKNIEDAKLFIQNLPEVNKVEIESWPYWAPTIPKITDNIDFEIRDAVTVE
ncbi:MAG: hypothetical protein V1679_02630 [Candidatus Peregrinibacteria bacterium]